ncbi:MAG TPA: tail fiber domain-containing protein [Pyrinomonadaceae bacterium]|nr:tail fiber domain-containing protein [Pyrinomonadaceae bacterium]
MKNPRPLPLLTAAVFLLACFHVSVFGQSNEIARVSAGGDTIRWDITVPYSAATVTVSGATCGVIRKEFKEGATPTFAAYDSNGARLPDGQYQYELRLTPVLSADTLKELAAARQKGGGQEADPDCRLRASQPSYPLVQSGAFAIMKGVIVVAGGVESTDGRQARRQAAPRPSTVRDDLPAEVTAFMPARFVETSAPSRAVRMAGQPFAHAAFPDDVIPDDLIVQGSLCVGLDCVNNESFGFDTIRLKENNTRIKFEDTSVGSFPTNDWQLTANDSASGGASKFSIEDITGSKVPFTITAGASTNSIFVDSTGRVGFRTSTPVLDLHAATSNTPAIRLEQNNSGGFTAQTWDIGSNEANFFIRDVTGGSKLSFRIRPGAPTSSIDIAANGNVGIGTASPDALLNVDKNQATGTEIRIDNTNAAGFAGLYMNGGFSLASGGFVQYNNTTGAKNLFVGTGGSDPLHLGTNNSIRMTILQTSGNVGIATTAPTDTLSVNGTASKPGGGSWAVFSDERLKNIKGSFNSGLKALMQLQPLRYEYKRDNALGLNSDGEHVGFGAQAVQRVIPEAVTATENGYLQINNDPILWTMLNAIKEQQKEIEQLKAEVRQLRQRRPASRNMAGRRRR